MKRRISTKKFLALFLAFLMVLGIVGCASNTGTNNTTNNGTTNDGGDTTSGGDTTAASAEFTYALSGEPITLDAHYITDVISGQVQWQIHETLFYREEDSTVTPLLAESAEEAEDGLSWTIKLKEGITFHDGTPFNAEAVKYVFDRLLADETASPKRSALDGVVSIEVPSEYEVKVNLAQRDLIFTAKLTNYTTSIMSPTALEQGGLDSYSDYAAGTGPLKLDTWNHGTDMVLVKNEDYWGEEPTVEKLTIRFVTEEATRVMMMETGEVDLANSISPLQSGELDALDTVNIVSKPGYRVVYVGLNNAKSPFNDVRVRQALNYAIDKETIANSIMAGMVLYPPSGMWPYTVEYAVQGLNPFELDLDKSRELLAEAGYPDGFDCTLHYSTGSIAMDTQTVTAIQSMLAEVGVNVELVQMERASLLQLVDTLNDESELELFFMSKGCSTGDPEFDMTLYINADGGQNYSRYNNPEVEAMVRDLPNSTDLEDRAQRLAEIQEIFNEDCGYLPLYYQLQIYAEAADVDGFLLYPNELYRLAWLTRT